MKKILETKLLEFDKSTFLVDLVKHENEALYVEVLQKIHGESSEGHRIKINPSILIDLVNTLMEFHCKIPTQSSNIVLRFTEEDKENIQNRYLKGISTSDLAMQFDTPETTIEMILRNRSIVVLKDIRPEKKFRWKKYRK